MEYQYKVDLIPDLPLIPYRNGIGAWDGIVIHDTACANDSDESEVAYFKKNWRTRQAFVHAFVSYDSMTQAAKWEYKSWSCGNGNSRFASIEMCSASSQAEFNVIYTKTCWLAAFKLYERKLGVIDGVTLVSHDWVRRNLGGTTHTDPIAYLKKWGKSWADMVKDVKAVYDDLSKPKPVPTPKPTPIPASSNEYGCNVYVNDKPISIQGFVIDGRSSVPVRLVADAYGSKVGWDKDKSQAIINGILIPSTVTRNGTGYAWSAEIAKSSGAKIEWDKKTKTVYFSKG